MSNKLAKFRKSIMEEKTQVDNKSLSINVDEDKFKNADKFFAIKENIEQKPEREKLTTSTFSMPNSEFQTIIDTMKLFLKEGYIIKQTEVFRIALAVLKITDAQTIYEVYNNLPKLSVGKPKSK